MGEFQIKESATPKKKKKNGMPGIAKFFIVLLCIIIGLPLIAVVGVYACFYDSAHTEVPVQENYPNDKVFNDLLVDSFDNTTTEDVHEVQVGLKKQYLNQILYNALKKNQQLSSYINNLYVDVETGSFSFVVEAGAFNIFKTRAFVKTSFIMDEENAKIVFHVEDVQLGRIHGMQRALDVVKSFVKLPDLSDVLKKAGFNMTINLDTLTIEYKLVDFYNDISKLIGGETGNFFAIVQELMLNQELRTVTGPEGDSIFSFNMKIDKTRTTKAVTGIDNFVVPQGFFEEELKQIVPAMKMVLDAGVVPSSDAELLAKYIMGTDMLVKGADLDKCLTWESQGVFDGVRTKYTLPLHDYTVKEEDSLNKIIENQVIAGLMTLSDFNVDVFTSQLDKMFYTSASLGVLAPFTANRGVGTGIDYKIAYCCSDRITLAINNNELYLIMNVNFNGYAGNITMELELKDTSEFGKAVFEMKNMYLGDSPVTPDTRKTFSRIITQGLEGGAFGDLIKVESTDESFKMTLDASSLLESLTVLPIEFDVKFVLKDSTATQPGAMEFQITKK